MLVQWIVFLCKSTETEEHEWKNISDVYKEDNNMIRISTFTLFFKIIGRDIFFWIKEHQISTELGFSLNLRNLSILETIRNVEKDCYNSRLCFWKLLDS